MPNIGITASSGRPVAEYVDALRVAGATSVVFPNDVARPFAVLDTVDGVLFTGGSDVDPAMYGDARQAETDAPEADRDAFEIALVREARVRDIPFLGICRGMQIANVAFGGSLEQHLPALGRPLRHSIVEFFDVDGKPKQHVVRGVIAEHIVTVDADSRLANVLGVRQLATNSRHHQALDRVADSLHVVARASDGTVEAVEPNFAARFWIAVQWHPETTVDDGGASRAIFAAFVDACASVPAMMRANPLVRLRPS